MKMNLLTLLVYSFWFLIYELCADLQQMSGMLEYKNSKIRFAEKVISQLIRRKRYGAEPF
ncbi:hypothetical protein B5E62_15500 [Lachnoclostridium sp. An118]|nr:hypothetical protein B5E62_15500 [Lachnoclostridium sp. An118]